MQTDSSITFAELQLAEPIQRALASKGYTHPSPIQAQAIPHILAGRDLIGLAQTGTGKTAAFSLPMLDRLSRRPARAQPRRPRALVLTPTRELAVQVGENIARYGSHLHLRHTLVFGGVGEQPQIRALAQGVDIVVATPGRLIDLMRQGHVALDQIECFVLDEADRMLDMGFAPDVKRIVAKLPQRRHSLLFSATMPAEIREIASSLLNNPVTVEVARVGTTAERIDQKLCFVPRARKHELLLHYLNRTEGRVLVFARTKRGADRLARNLQKDGVEADSIHGDKSQGARQRALRNFSDGSVPVLVATDIAARGIDVKDISLVVNYELPEEPESYVHRIGRTARAGASGLAVAFCDAEEHGRLRDVQKLLRNTIPVEENHPYASEGAAMQPRDPAPRGGGRGGKGRGGQGQVRLATHRSASGSDNRTRRGHHAPRPAHAAPETPDSDSSRRRRNF
jgi:ATP-dependent RNA helicase RhlE